MIQRIQTLYLLIAAALMTVAVFSPLAVFNVGAAEYTLSSFSLAGEGGSFATLLLGILLAVSALLPLATLFLYKRRQLQIRLCAVELVLLIGCIVFIGIYYWLSNRMFTDFDTTYRRFAYGALMPLLSLVPVWLAMRAIFRDEVLVRSLDRIRARGYGFCRCGLSDTGVSDSPQALLYEHGKGCSANAYYILGGNICLFRDKCSIFVFTKNLKIVGVDTDMFIKPFNIK